MAEERLTDWHPLFRRAVAIIEAAQAGGGPLTWSFGGGTALMLRYGHRYSHDVDIFVPDPQWLGFLSPRLNVVAEDLCEQFIEGSSFIKLSFAEGEIDFVASGWLVDDCWQEELLLDRPVRIETPAEIIGKKLHFRAAEFKARDLYDLATVLELEPAALAVIRPMIREKSPGILDRMERARGAMEQEFDALERYHPDRTFDRCLEIISGTAG